MSAAKTTTAAAATAAVPLSATPGVKLPSGPKSHFMEIFKLIDDKLYKKAVKAADAVLKDVPNHGESLAMKALALLNMNKKEEALEQARAGLKSHVKSPICWHVYGMIHKQDNNMTEALKALKNAFQLEPDNAQIQRDLSLVQIQTRDYRGHHETRRAMLTSKSNLATNWLGLAVAHQLAGNCELALAVLEQYETTLEPTVTPTYEASEMQLYKIRIVEQMGSPEKALALLDKLVLEGKILDTIAILENRAQLLLSLKRYDAALTAYLALLDINSEHFGYHRGVQSCVLKRSDAGHVAQNFRLHFDNLTDNELNSLIGVYIALHRKNSRSRATRRIILDLLPASHPLFQPVCAAYLRAAVRKGLPSLFTDIKHLLRNAEESSWPWNARQAHRLATHRKPYPTQKAAVIADIVSSFAASLKGGKPLPQFIPDVDAVFSSLKTALGGDSDAATSKVGVFAAQDIKSLINAAGDESEDEPPSSYPWIMLLSAKLQDEFGNSDAALAEIDAAIKHTPTVIDLHVAKARFLKHTGNISAAADTADEARQLDLADRFLNTKAVKYLLRDCRIEQANRTMALFSRMDAKETTGDPLGNVKSLQVVWFEVEKAEAYERLGTYGLAIKHFARVERHFKDYVDDQYDFHGYCLRKGALRSYADTLAVMDKMFSHAQCLRALVGLARCYFALHFDVKGRVGTARWTAAEENTIKTPQEASQLVQQTIEKAEQSVADAKASAASIQAATKTRSSTDDDGADKEEDLLGDEKAAVANPLEEAYKYITLAVQNLPAYKPGASSVASFAQQVAGVKLPTPTLGGSVAPPTSLSTRKNVMWNIDPDFIASTCALASEISLARNKLLPALFLLQCAQKAAEQSRSAAVHSALIKDSPLGKHFFHPKVASASLAVLSAIHTEINAAVSPLAPAMPVLNEFYNASAQAGGNIDGLRDKLREAGKHSVDMLLASVKSTLFKGTPASTLFALPLCFAGLTLAPTTSAVPAAIPNVAADARSITELRDVLTLAVSTNSIETETAAKVFTAMKSAFPHVFPAPADLSIEGSAVVTA